MNITKGNYTVRLVKSALLDIMKATLKTAFLMLKNTKHMSGKRLGINALNVYTYQRILQALRVT